MDTMMCLYDMAEQYNLHNIKRNWDCFTVKDIEKLKRKKFVNFCTDVQNVEVRYDAIFLDDEIEKVEQPVWELKKWKNFLKEGGWLFFTISNIANYQVINRLLNNGTMRNISCRYTLRDLQGIIAEAGYSYSKYVTIKDDVDDNSLINCLADESVLPKEHTLFDHWYCMMISCDDPALYKYQLPYPLYVRRELGYLLRRIENDISIKSNVCSLLELCKTYNISGDDLYYAVEHMTINQENVLRVLTALLEKGVCL